MSTEGEKRKLVDLRVVDLRAELEKRGLESKGVKATLIDRLQKVLQEEGHAADEFFFDIEPVKTPKRSNLKQRTEHDTECETLSNADDNHDVTLDTSLDAEEEAREEEDEERGMEVKEEEEGTAGCSMNGTPHKVVSSPALAPAFMETPPTGVADDVNGSPHPLKNADEAQDLDKGVPEANGVDNEDSINLTIGEDEEKLLADEVGHEEDSSSQEKEAKDEGERAASKAEDGSAAGENKKPAGQQEEDKDMATQDDKIEKSEEENNGKAGEKGKSAVSSADQKSAKEEKDKRAKAAVPASSSRNLWVSGLSSSTRATDLKQVFSKYGKVIGAKVVTNARTPGARCYGYVTMATSDDASKCIQHLHRTELHGRMISVERAKGDAAGPPKKGAEGRTDARAEARAAAARRAEEKKRHERRAPGNKSEERKEGGASASPAASEGKGEDAAAPEGGEAVAAAKGEAAAGAEGVCAAEGAGEGEAAKGEHRATADKGRASRDVSREASREVSRERARRRSAGSSHYSQHSRQLSRSPHRRFRASPARRPGVLTFTQIREERERQRLRERERELREEERRRREEAARQREIERRQREEAVRLEREKERLRIERERIESERAELMRLERERQRLEREKLEREREELKRQQMRFEEARRSTKRQSDDRRDSYGEDRKRVATDRRYEGSQSSRFDENTRSNEFQGKKEYKEFPTGGSGGRRTVGAAYEAEVRSRGDRGERGEGPKKDLELPRREAVADAGRGKDSRFERGPGFRVRDERRPDSDHRPKVDIRHSARDRYPDSAKGERYSERSGEWHAAGGPPPVKAFSSLGGPSGRDSWGGSERKAEGQGWGRPMDSNASDRWVSSGGPMPVSRGPTMGPMYSGQQGVTASAPGMGMSISGVPYGSDRFEYKQSMGPMRKY